MNDLRVNVAPGVEYGSEARKFQGIASLEMRPGGRLWAVWYAGPITGTATTTWSASPAATTVVPWSDLRFVLDPDGDGLLRAFDPASGSIRRAA